LRVATVGEGKSAWWPWFTAELAELAGAAGPAVHIIDGLPRGMGFRKLLDLD
jgi:hypothetical protein